MKSPLNKYRTGASLIGETVYKSPKHRVIQIGVIPSKKPANVRYPNAQAGFRQRGDPGYKPSNGVNVGP